MKHRFCQLWCQNFLTTSTTSITLFRSMPLFWSLFETKPGSLVHTIVSLRYCAPERETKRRGLKKHKQGRSVRGNIPTPCPHSIPRHWSNPCLPSCHWLIQQVTTPQTVREVKLNRASNMWNQLLGELISLYNQAVTGSHSSVLHHKPLKKLKLKGVRNTGSFSLRVSLTKLALVYT